MKKKPMRAGVPGRDSRRSPTAFEAIAGLRRYSGEESRAFWARIGRLSRAVNGPLYSMGCLLQNVEEHVLIELEEQERQQAVSSGRAMKGARTPPARAQRRKTKAHNDLPVTPTKE